MPYHLDGNCVIKTDTGETVKCHQTRQQAMQHLAALQLNVSEESIMPEHARLFYEATIKPVGEEPSGKEWEITIIGAKNPGEVVTLDGEQFIYSSNRRLYAVKALKESAPQWEGIKVYDNHLTQDEFEKKQGMRSPVKEWLGTIVKPRWDEAAAQLRGLFKVVENELATKLKSAWEQGILGSIGFSIDTFPIIEREIEHDGQKMPVIEGFAKILSVDLVGDPAAGGQFNRLIASQQLQMEANNAMNPDEVKQLIQDQIAGIDIAGQVRAALADAQTAEAEATTEEEAEAEGEQPEVEAKKKKKDDMPPEMIDQMKKKEGEEDEAAQAKKEAQLARCALLLERKLMTAKLPEAFETVIRQAFENKVFEEAELDRMIKAQKEAQASADTSGRVTENGQQRQAVKTGLNEKEKIELELMRLIMGNTEFRGLEHSQESFVKERLQEGRAYQSWLNAGKPNTGNYRRLSQAVYDFLGGDPFMDERAMEAATSSTLTTVVKNTVNIMVAADYSLQQRWYEPLVKVEEVDTIDTATLARLYGVSTLSIVNEGQAYTELTLADEEETAAFVKKGNYIGITMETLMLDKLNYVRTIPRRLSDTWYNTLSALTAGVFTVNTAAGPVLADSGALFNATAATSAGGHANLLTAALSFTGFGAARTAMRKQTNQPLGVGRRMQIEPRYLLVAEDLETTALQIRNSEQLPGSANNDINPYYQKFDVVVVPDWTDANDWALMGDPMRFPAIYHIFPRGGRTPQLFTADNEATGAMFTNDTMRFKVRMLTYHFSATYDCAPVSDFRPLHKNNVT